MTQVNISLLDVVANLPNNAVSVSKSTVLPVIGVSNTGNITASSLQNNTVGNIKYDKLLVDISSSSISANSINDSISTNINNIEIIGKDPVNTVQVNYTNDVEISATISSNTISGITNYINIIGNTNQNINVLSGIPSGQIIVNHPVWDEITPGFATRLQSSISLGSNVLLSIGFNVDNYSSLPVISDIIKNIGSIKTSNIGTGFSSFFNINNVYFSNISIPDVTNLEVDNNTNSLYYLISTLLNELSSVKESILALDITSFYSIDSIKDSNISTISIIQSALDNTYFSNFLPTSIHDIYIETSFNSLYTVLSSISIEPVLLFNSLSSASSEKTIGINNIKNSIINNISSINNFIVDTGYFSAYELLSTIDLITNYIREYSSESLAIDSIETISQYFRENTIETITSFNILKDIFPIYNSNSLIDSNISLTNIFDKLETSTTISNSELNISISNIYNFTNLISSLSYLDIGKSTESTQNILSDIILSSSCIRDYDSIVSNISLLTYLAENLKNSDTLINSFVLLTESLLKSSTVPSIETGTIIKQDYYSDVYYAEAYYGASYSF